MSGGKPVISAARMYAVIVALDGGANVFDLSSGADQQAALRKALRCGYLRPSRRLGLQQHEASGQPSWPTPSRRKGETSYSV